VMEGKGSLTVTGQIGEIMQESAQAALTYARAHAREFGYGDVDFDKIDIHIHVPEGAIPKDGPSAGVTICTSLISALSERPVRHDVAMTGELTLRGRVLPIGGLKEKLLAAHRLHIKTVLIPKRNQRDLTDVPREIQRQLKLVLIERVEEILPYALLEPPAAPPKPKRPPRPRKKKEPASPGGDGIDREPAGVAGVTVAPSVGADT
jgi:ATP-dependent Lon protease